MNTINSTTVKTQTQLVWLVDYSAEPINEKRDGKRSSDGKFLKKHCKLTTRRSSDFNEMLADEAFSAA